MMVSERGRRVTYKGGGIPGRLDPARLVRTACSNANTRLRDPPGARLRDLLDQRCVQIVQDCLIGELTK
jgi:hypothetical protein